MKATLLATALILIGGAVVYEYETKAFRVWALERKIESERQRIEYLQFKLEFHNESEFRDSERSLERLNTLIANDSQIASRHSWEARAWGARIKKTEAQIAELKTLQEHIKELELALSSASR